MDLEDEEYYYSKLKTRGKIQCYMPKVEILKVKHRARRSKCVGDVLNFCEFVKNKPQMDSGKNENVYRFISNDIWFHLAKHIAPEDVGCFSLICTQSANTVNSRIFWLQMYRRYCQHTSNDGSKWLLQLPENLQMKHIKDCDKNTLRQSVIKALFCCYQPFKLRMQNPYKLETLVGRCYVSSWHNQVECVWIMCYKFKNMHSSTSATQLISENNEDTDADRIVEDWESLAEEKNNNLYKLNKANRFAASTTSAANDLDGASILVICCDRFIPFPSDIIYNQDTRPFRLAASRELLSTDMRSKNLELDFISNTRDQTITVKYTKILKFKVLPWWHPDFRILNKC